MEPHEIDRRTFVGMLGAGALIFGLGDLARADEPAEDAAWRAALERMGARGAHGVVIVVPEGAEARARLGEQLQARIPLVRLHHQAAPPLACWLIESVWVCASAARAQAQPGETLVLVDPQGRRVAGAQVDLSGDEAFLRGVEALLAPGLDARAEAQMTPEVAAALKQAEADPWALAHHLDRAASVVLRASRAVKDEQRANALRALFQDAYWSALTAPTGLPFGVRWEVKIDEPEPCPPCGMASPSIEARRFLGFFPPS